MARCSWEKIESFQSLGEYKRFVKWIEALAKNGECEEVSYTDVNQNDPWSDRRFKCNESGEIWKLSCPDPGYYSGSWLPEY